ncbi:hypothetical protein SAMN05421823_101545 [Catalinimonas alkaloidigena]|uniref:Uncharacterized protein n=1 Tax=Catalinimonas alkaloidigena TaxID=1075417 RepID=A0A1G8Y1Z1_9BACT|nr:hypothetical protein [Catalinimonas alkaloidigena]SDJ96796.1 hypothetical protein SAMN05421823_101545 [Catalinimonas alkaloidigena]
MFGMLMYVADILSKIEKKAADAAAAAPVGKWADEMNRANLYAFGRSYVRAA